MLLAGPLLVVGQLLFTWPAETDTAIDFERNHFIVFSWTVSVIVSIPDRFFSWGLHWNALLHRSVPLWASLPYHHLHCRSCWGAIRPRSRDSERSRVKYIYLRNFFFFPYQPHSFRSHDDHGWWQKVVLCRMEHGSRMCPPAIEFPLKLSHLQVSCWMSPRQWLWFCWWPTGEDVGRGNKWIN